MTKNHGHLNLQNRVNAPIALAFYNGHRSLGDHILLKISGRCQPKYGFRRCVIFFSSFYVGHQFDFRAVATVVTTSNKIFGRFLMMQHKNQGFA